MSEDLGLLSVTLRYWMFPGISKEPIAFIFKDQWSKFLISSLHVRKLNDRAPVHSFAFARGIRVHPILL